MAAAWSATVAQPNPNTMLPRAGTATNAVTSARASVPLCRSEELREIDDGQESPGGGAEFNSSADLD